MLSHPDDAPEADFVLITALEEERDALLAKLPGYERLAPSSESIHIYYSARVPVIFPGGSTGTYRVIVVPLLGIGRVQATVATSEAIRRWNPRYVILVGIAGGIAAMGVRLGDILVSDQVVDYELQELTPEGPQIRWQVYRADPRLLTAARNLGDDWQQLVGVKRPVSGKPNRHIGPIASGDKVVAFGEVLAKYRDKWPALIGVEMEAAGAAAATFQSVEPPGFFMVRGVSDHADEEKGSSRVEKWRSYACDAAASYTIALLKSGFVPLATKQQPQAKEPTVTTQQRTKRPPRAVLSSPKLPVAPVTVPIPAGPFWLGSPPDDWEASENTKPGRQFYLPEYQISRYPITNIQYARFVREAGYEPPSHWINGQVPPDLEDHPVVNVNYDDAEAYCRWLSQFTRKSFRLPTEAEWEKAARGGLPDKWRYVWGDEWQPNFCNTEELKREGTSSVYEFERTNQSSFGVVDMAGNVWEWTSSWYEAYPGSSHESEKYGQVYRVVRGGSWYNPARDARISCRGRYKPDVRRLYLGFRILQSTGVSSAEIDYGAGSVMESKPVDRVNLRQYLMTYFDQSELLDVCFDLNIDHQSLSSGGKKAELVRELIAYCERYGRLPELVETCRRSRPDIPW